MQKSFINKENLLDTLVLYTKLFHKPFSKEAILSGLPQDKNNIGNLFSLKHSKSIFSRAAAKAGLKSVLIERSIKEMLNMHLPVIALLSNENTCIIEKFSADKSKVKVVYPSDELLDLWVDIDDLEKDYLGFSFLLKEAYSYSVDNKILKLDVKHWFWSSINLSRHIYKDVLLASILINIFILATPLFTMNVYDRVIPNNAIETLWVFAIGIIFIFFLDAFLKTARTYLLELAAKKSDIIISSIIYERIMDLKLSSIPKSVGSLVSNLKEFDSIRSFLTNATLTAIIDFPFAILFLAVVYYIAGVLVLVPLFTMELILLYAYFVSKPLKKSIESTHEASARKNGILVESLQNIETIKTLGIAGQMQWNLEESTGEIASKSLKSRLLSSSVHTVSTLLSQLNTVVIVVVGVYLIKDFELTMGGLIATVILSGRIVSPASQAAALITNYNDAKSTYETLNDIISGEAERPKGKKFVQYPNFKGKIEFIDVTFTYPDQQRPSLSHISFVINSGERIGIIGRIGSGKSTIHKLILGLYQADSGTILIDGIDINQIDPADLRRNIAYVEQKISLFKGTVRENITQRAFDDSDASIHNASKIAGADEFINKHPKGYDMLIGEGGRGLSGGQLQSIAIARAVINDLPIVLLDEPSNAMDQLSENKLLASLNPYLRNKTTILVTQKMSLLKLVSRIIVIENAKIVLDGKKDDVLQKLQNNAKG
jgi:ATP-binding cassette subfamily C protein LapB